MIVLALTADGINTALAQDQLLVHNLLNSAMSRLGNHITTYAAYVRPSGQLEVFADCESILITYRAEIDGRLTVMITDYNDKSPMPALEVLVENLHPKKHNYKILLKKPIA